MTYAYGKSLLPSTVGFDRLLTTLNEFEELFEQKKPQTYPPYNIVKFDDDNYQIQIAVAGFDKNEIVIETKNNQLTVNGEIKSAYTSDVVFLYRGLSTRDFSHSFTLSDTVVVKSADIVNGVLKIDLQNIVPEEKKPRKIPIGNEMAYHFE
jgi:molecular chaperone IbpA